MSGRARSVKCEVGNRAPGGDKGFWMIDLHSHILPGIDDGAADEAVSLEMARAYVAQGVRAVACTPHILPGVYHNSPQTIRTAVARLQARLDEEGLPLYLATGADNHVVADFVPGLKAGRLLTLGDTRYVLVEPPHNVAPPRLDDLVFGILLAGYMPIITHPERLKWIEGAYDLVCRLSARGVWMQVTSGSLTGRFGRRPQYWAERMVGEGQVQILASDAHDAQRRPPDLDKGFRAAERLVGTEEAIQMVSGRPSYILNDYPPADCAPICVNPPDDERGEGAGDAQGSRGGDSGGLVGRLRRLLSR